MHLLTCSSFMLIVTLAFYQMARTGISFSAVISRAEDRILVVHATNTKNQPLTGVVLGARGDSSVSSPSDTAGRARIILAPQTKVNSELTLQIVRAPSDLVFISPWDSRVRVPPFENDSQNYVQVVLAERGDRALLENGLGLVAIISKINEANSPKRIAEHRGEDGRQEERARLDLTSRLAVLAEVSREYGLRPEEVDRAIRDWSGKQQDPFNVGLAALYARNYPEAAKHLSESLQTRLIDLEKAQARVIDAASFLGQALFEQGKYRDAVEAYKKAAELRPGEGNILNNLGASLFYAGDYAQSEVVLQRALATSEKELGANSNEVAMSLSNLAEVYQAKGDYGRAESLLLRSSAIVEKNMGNEHQLFATSLSKLAELYRVKGDYARAEPLLLRALTIDEKKLGPEHPDIAGLLGTLAQLYKAQKNYDRAYPLLSRALELSIKTQGKEHPRVALLLNSMAELDRLTGAQKSAESLAQHSLRILEGSLGPAHPYVAKILNNLALISKANGDYKRAKILLERARSIHMKGWGSEHPDVAETLNNLAELYRADGDVNQALTLHAQATEIIERHLALVLASGSEEQNRLYLTTLESSTDSIISLNTREAPAVAQATRLAMTTVVRHKGRVLNTSAGSIAAIRQRLDPASRELLNRLAGLRSELAKLILKGGSEIPTTSRRRNINELEAEAEKIETAIINKLADFGLYSQPLTLAKIQEAIPEDAVLIEIMAYKPFNQKARVENTAWGEERYVAYVLKRHGDPVGVELGDAKSINTTAAKFRLALATNQSPVKAIARELDETVMRPIRRQSGSAKHLLISPDGILNIIPFGALVKENDRFLVQDYTLTYLTSGSDLVRMQSRIPSQQPPFILANPTVNFKDALSSRPAILAVPPAPPVGAFQEALYLRDRIPNSTFVAGGAATEKALKNVYSPSILHVSTYSFFINSSTEHVTRGSSSPLIHAGLILAEASQQLSTGEDGIMTALEATLLDLHGTKLVVLSGCETGVGELQDGEGVYGFRRALVIAGSETQVISLWKVADEPTQELIIGYYQRVLAGEGRAEALRQVQLGMLASYRWKHPFYWASFIQSGDWRSMDVKNLSIK